MNDTTRSVAVNPDSPAHTTQNSNPQGEVQDESQRLGLEKQSQEKNVPGAFTREPGGSNDSGGNDGRLINGADTGADGS